MGTRSIPYARGLNIVSDADGRSVLLVNVYQRRRVKRDALVGWFADTIGGVLGKLENGGTKILCTTWSTDASSAIKVLEGALHTPDGSDLSAITIKFALAAEPRGGVGAGERQAKDAVTAANSLGSTPAAVEHLSSTVDTGPNVIQTLESTWGILLQRMELFNRIVDDIAQVFGAQCLYSLTV